MTCARVDEVGQQAIGQTELGDQPGVPVARMWASSSPVVEALVRSATRSPVSQKASRSGMQQGPNLVVQQPRLASAASW